jgi:hypothetical protein
LSLYVRGVSGTTNFQFVSRFAFGSTSTVDTGVVYDTTKRHFEIRQSATDVWQLYVDGVFRAQVSSTLPWDGNAGDIGVRIIATSTAQRTAIVDYISLETNALTGVFATS